MNSYKEALFNEATQNMTKDGFNLLMKINSKIPDIWNRPSSSTGKYHKKSDGSIPSIAHHTFEMFYTAAKIIRMFGESKKSKQNDAFFIAIFLHDLRKYGKDGKLPHTTRNHDSDMADLLEKNKKVLMKYFSEAQTYMIIDGIKFHSGRWSASVPNINNFDFEDYHPIVMFVHMFDMLSTADCLKYPEIKSEEDLQF
jgi:hypothetical protein